MRDAARPVRLLTVCLGNICRSPTAAAALVVAAAQAGRHVDVQSAGTGTWHIGNPPDSRMSAAAQNEGLTLTGTAERINAQMLREADIVFAMDRTNLRDIMTLAATAQLSPRVYLFRDFDPQVAHDPDVPDPYYGGDEGFNEVVAICRRTARTIIGELDALVSDSPAQMR